MIAGRVRGKCVSSVPGLGKQRPVARGGSLLDDGGSVATEAMGQGLAVVAPDLAPFDEIVGDAGVLYEAMDSASFRRAIIKTLPQVESARLASWSRARSVLARVAFVDQLDSLSW